MKHKAFVLLLLGLFVTSCSAGAGRAPLGSNVLPSAASPALASATGTGTVSVTIAIPKKAFFKSHYVSVSTKSIVIKVRSAHHKLLLKKTQNLRRGVKGCKNESTALLCTFAFSVAAGNDRFSAVTYDAPNGKGNELSVLLNLARTVKAGKTVKLPLALAGIARSLLMELVEDEDSVFSTGNSTTGYLFAGLISHSMQVVPLDADGNLILGPGAPPVELVSSDPATLGITANAGATGEFLLTPHGAASGITLTASAKLAIGVAVKSTATLSIDSVLYVANYGSATPGGSVTAYVPWSDAPVETITSGVDNAAVLTVDGSGDVWVGNDAGGASGAASITEYPPGSTTPVRTISGLTQPSTSGRALAVDASGNLYCACNSAREVDEFTPAGGSTPSRTLTAISSPTGISSPYSVVTDASGNLYVANLGSNAVGVSVFAPGAATTPFRNITSGINGVSLLAMDALGNLYAGNSSANPNTVTEYPPGSGTVSNTFDSLGDLTNVSGLAVDRSGDVYMADSASPTNSIVVQFSPASPTIGSRTLVMNDAYVYATAVDPAGNVYVPLSNSSTVLVYPPGTSTTASRTLTNGIDHPWDVAAWP
jgi:hypothetical protein